MDIHLSQLFKHELSLVPSALCSEYWDMRKGNKPTLVEKLAVFPTAPLQPVDHELIDGNEAIYHTSWQGNTTVESFTTTFLTPFMICTLCLISIKRYPIKFHERQWRAMGAMPHDYVLTGSTKLPAREEIMKVTTKKTHPIHNYAKLTIPILIHTWSMTTETGNMKKLTLTVLVTTNDALGHF